MCLVFKFCVGYMCCMLCLLRTWIVVLFEEMLDRNMVFKNVILGNYVENGILGLLCYCFMLWPGGVKICALDTYKEFSCDLLGILLLVYFWKRWCQFCFWAIFWQGEMEFQFSSGYSGWCCKIIFLKDLYVDNTLTSSYARTGLLSKSQDIS